MGGMPKKRVRREIAEEAVLRAAHEALRMSAEEVDRAILKAYEEEGEDPVLLMMPTARALVKAGLGGDIGAIREALDRVSGKVSQEVVMPEGGVGGLVDMALLGAARELLGRLPVRVGRVVEDE